MGQTIFFKRWNLLSAALRELDGCDSLDALLEVLRRSVRRIAVSDGVAVIRRDGDLVTYVGEDAITPLWAGQSFPIATCVSGMAILQRAPVVIPSIHDDPRVPLNYYLATFVQSMAVFPIGGGNPVAALGCYWAEAKPIEPGAMALIDQLTRSSNTALERMAIAAERRRPSGARLTA